MLVASSSLAFPIKLHNLGLKVNIMRGLLTIQTDHDFCVHHRGAWMYDYHAVIQIESMEDLKEVGLIDKHDGSGKSDNVRADIERVIKDPHCGYDSTGGNCGIVWVPNATKKSHPKGYHKQTPATYSPNL